ncbi:carboxymuconolactone decarboxylase family protein [Nocardia sp. NPDC005366]|uniref:carboxymuconolactone decarboxylase family protein n=1 Tax=Nocardia sp. NPDC005366 TaxID=3156878 RepID=UPI0033BE5096
MTAEHEGPRLAPLSAAQWGDAEYAAFGVLLGIPGEKVPRAGSGHEYDPLKFDIVGLLAHHPELARAFLRFNTYLLRRGELPLRLRELAILRVACTHRSAYEWGQHVKIAVGGGVSEDDITRLAAGNDGFEGDDRLVLEITDELLVDGHATWEMWQRLVDALGMHQAMELIFVVGTYAMAAMAFVTWGLPPAPGAAPLPIPADISGQQRR